MKLPISLPPVCNKRSGSSLLLRYHLRPVVERLEDRTAPARLGFVSGGLTMTASASDALGTSSVSSLTGDSDVNSGTNAWVQTGVGSTIINRYGEFSLDAFHYGEGASFTGNTTTLTLRIVGEPGESAGATVAIDVSHRARLGVNDGTANGTFTASATVGATTTPIYSKTVNLGPYEIFDELLQDNTTIYATVGQTFTLNLSASGDAANFGSFDPGFEGTFIVYLDLRPGTVSVKDLIANSVTLDLSNSRVELSYTIVGSLSQKATIRLYWAAGPAPANIVGSLVTSVPSSLQKGTHTLFVPAADLGRRPPSASHFVLVIDEADVVTEINEANNFASVVLPPAVVNVFTHGFNPQAVAPTYDPSSPAWTSFLNVWKDLRNNMDSLAEGTVLKDQVVSSVTEWDSTTGWRGAIASVLAGVGLGIWNPLAVGLTTAIAKWVFLPKARALAEKAAVVVQNAVQAGLLTDPGLAKALQRVHLVGHSRGAAVNARAASLLAKKGYLVDQYTALDGYSTDWPNVSDVLADIDIVAELTPLPTRLGNDYETFGTRKVNYRVETGLDFGTTEVINWLGSMLVRPFTSADTDAIDLDSWKAPERDGFENFTIILGGGETTNHVNVTRTYASIYGPDPEDSDFNRLNADTNGDSIADTVALKDNFLGAVSLGLLSSATSSAAGASSASLAATASTSVPVQDFSNFWDGTFAGLGSVLQEFAATTFPTIDSAVLDTWLALVGDGTPLIAELWNTTGDVTLASLDTDPALQLTQTADTSIGQLLFFDAADQTIEFDLDIVAAGAGDFLEVVFDGQTFAQLDLSTLPANGHYNVSLDGRASAHGMVTFRLAGPLETPAVVQLDNLAVSPFPFADDFNRPNSTDLGPNWVETEGDFSIANQKLRSAATSTALVDAGTVADVSVAATVNVRTTGKSKQAGLVARENGGDFYYAYVSSNKSGVHKAFIRKSVGGVWTTLLTKRVSKPTGLLVLDVVGTTLTLTYRGKLVGSVTDNALSAGSFGVRGLRGTIDNFSAVDPASTLSSVQLASTKMASTYSASSAESGHAALALLAVEVSRKKRRWPIGQLRPRA